MRFFKRKKNDQDRERKRTQLQYEHENGAHRFSISRDMHYHRSAPAPAQSRTDLQLPRGGDVTAVARERGQRGERRGGAAGGGGGGGGARGRIRSSTTPEQAQSRPPRVLAPALAEESEDEEAVMRMTSDANTGNNTSPAVATAAPGRAGVSTTAVEQYWNAFQSVGGDWSPYIAGAAVGIGAVCAPFIAASAATATGYACAAAGVTMIASKISDNSRAVQQSHDQRAIAEAQIEATKEVRKHKETVEAQERVMKIMAENGQTEALAIFRNGGGNGSGRKRGHGRYKEVGGSRNAGLLEYHHDFDSC